jgi:hypothetical protein
MTQPLEDGIYEEFDLGCDEAIRVYSHAPTWVLEGEVASANAREADPTWRESGSIMYELGRHQGLREALAAREAMNQCCRGWFEALPQEALSDLIMQLCELVVVDPRNSHYQQQLRDASEVWEERWPQANLPLLPPWYVDASDPRPIELMVVAI